MEKPTGPLIKGSVKGSLLTDGFDHLLRVRVPLPVPALPVMTKKKLEWQGSNEHSREQFGTI